MSLGRRAPAAIGRRPLLRSLALIALALAAACSDDDPTELKPAGAYARAIAWFLERDGLEEEPPVVFVLAHGEGFQIGLQLQADIINASDELVGVQPTFIDDRAEALDDAGDVRDEGLFLFVGPAIQEGGAVRIDIEEYVREDDRISWQFVLRRQADEWTLSRTPVEHST